MSSERWSRRSFLVTSLGGASMLLGGLAVPGDAGAAARSQARRAAPRKPTASKELPPRVRPAAGPPAAKLRLYATNVQERLEVAYRDESGAPDPDGLAAINHLLRCHATGEVGEIDIRVLDFLSQVRQQVGGQEIHVISGFRSREYNDYLARRQRTVARDSLHLAGRALDLRIPAAPARAVRQTALALGQGGVGYYPRAGFVHLDSGPYRYW